MSTRYDVIVVGAGSMGMSAGYELASRGLKTLLIDAFDPPHAHGSHHGEPRLIRRVYGGGPAYVKLALRADEKWLALEQATGERLLERSGVLNFTDPAVFTFDERFKDASELGVAYETLTGAEVRRRWPQVHVPDEYRAMYEPGAGYLYSEKCVKAYRALALAAGAKLLTNAPVDAIRPSKGSVAVRAGGDIYEAEHVVLSAGAWMSTFAELIDAPIRAVRKVVGWFRPRDGSFDAGAFPGFTIGAATGIYYGFPSIDGAGVKIGRHDGGVPWKPGEPLAPFGAYPEDEADLRGALEKYLPASAGELVRGVACKYELTPDEHFIIDDHPSYSNVHLAAGFSGHGFKFASVVGELLADRIADGRWSADVSMFSLSRFAAAGEGKEA